MASAALDPGNRGIFPTPDSVQFERVYRGDAATLWSFLTRPELLQEWLAGAKVDLRVGGRIELDFSKLDSPGHESASSLMGGVITHCEPGRRLRYTWRETSIDDELDDPSEVTFELEPAGENQTLLRLIHRNLGARHLSGFAAGWHSHLLLLEERLAGRAPFDIKKLFEELEPLYGTKQR